MKELISLSFDIYSTQKVFSLQTLVYIVALRWKKKNAVKFSILTEYGIDGFMQKHVP